MTFTISRSVSLLPTNIENAIFEKLSRVLVALHKLIIEANDQLVNLELQRNSIPYFKILNIVELACGTKMTILPISRSINLNTSKISYRMSVSIGNLLINITLSSINLDSDSQCLSLS